MERKLVSIRTIEEIRAIPERDKIVAYRVDNWWVIDQKDKYQVGDKVVYFEPDCWVPTTIAPFLSKGKEPRVYNEVRGERLKTIRMGGQVSQGLLMPLSILDCIESEMDESLDYAYPLYVQKWEKEIPACLAGQCKGNFPSEIPKTDATRIQNLRGNDLQALVDDEWTFTEKLHGTSATYFLDRNLEFHVCSRNMDLKETEGNTYWEVANKLKIEHVLRSVVEYNRTHFGDDPQFEGFAIQGEICGPGINGNQYGLSEPTLFVFHIYSVASKTYFTSDIQNKFLEIYLPHVKTVPDLENLKTGNSNVQEYLDLANGTSLLNNSKREGFVMKSKRDPNLIVKVISNDWLLAGGDDQ